MAAQHRPLIMFVAMLMGVWGFSAFALGCPHGCDDRTVLSESAETSIEPSDTLFRNSAVQLEKAEVVPDATSHSSASDDFHIDFPRPGPSPSSDSYDHPPPALWNLKAANVHADYATMHPNPTPDYHDLAPPTVNFDSDYAPAHFHSDYSPAHASPTPDNHDYPPPAVNFHSDYAPPHENPTPDNHDYPPPASMNF